MQKERLQIEKVAQRFAELSFDDTKGKQYCRQILEELLKTDQTLPRDGEAKEAKDSMIVDMKKLVSIIDEHIGETLKFFFI